MVDKRDEYTTRDGRSAYYDPQKMDAIIDERDRLRAELETAQGKLTEKSERLELARDKILEQEESHAQEETFLYEQLEAAQAQVAALRTVVEAVGRGAWPMTWDTRA